MFMVIFFALVGIALYILLKPPTNSEYEQALIINLISEPELEETKQLSKRTYRRLGKSYN